jgi:hypothetical protein
MVLETPHMKSTKKQLETENAGLRDRVAKLEASEAALKDVILRLASAPCTPTVVPFPLPAAPAPIPSPWQPIPTLPWYGPYPHITCEILPSSTITVAKPDVMRLDVTWCAPPFASGTAFQMAHVVGASASPGIH